MRTSQQAGALPRPARRARPSAFTLGITLALVVSSLAITASGQSGRTRPVRPGGAVEDPRPTAQAVRRGQAVVSGRVVYEGTGQPVRGARVRLSSRSGAASTGATVTDARGEFRFEHLAAGDYFVIVSPPDAPAVSAAGFRLPLPSGDARADDAAFEAARRESDPAGAVTEVSIEATGTTEVELRIRRSAEVGGSVSGRVVYTDGKPGDRAQVILIRRDAPPSEGQFRTLGPTRLTVLADEQGRYRLNGVPPGEYLVRAQLQETVYRDQQGRTYGGLVVRAYYPSATGARGAAPVAVETGGETSGVDIMLTRRPTRTLGGRLVTRGEHRPLGGVHVRLRAREDVDLPFATGEDDRFAWTDAQGRFSFDNVMDGDYVISFGGLMSPEAPPVAGAVNRPPTRPGLPPRMGQAPPLGRVLPPASGRIVETRREVSVAGADMKDLLVEAATGGRVAGVVVVEGGAPLPPRVLVMSDPPPGERRPAAVARVAPDGSFVLGGVPEGPLALNVVAAPGYYVRSILVGGAETGGAPFYVADGAEVGDVRVVLSTATALFTGRVLSSNGHALRGATVLLVPAERTGASLRSRLIGVTDTEGRFAVQAGPGEFLVVVWTGRPPASEEELRAMTTHAPRITLREGERTTLDLNAPDR